MNPSSLVRHPAPFSTESFLGYILRLSQVNGYVSPWTLFALAGMKQSEIRTTGIRCDRLAIIANRNVSELDAIAYSAPEGHPRWCRILGHPVVLGDVDLHAPKFCPRCVEEKGFIEAHWDLTLMVACPIHRCLLISRCPKCEKSLRWFRPGLLECECEAQVMDVDQTIISQELASLVGVIRRKVLKEKADIANPSLMPLVVLLAMDLRAILSVIRTLGKHRLLADNDRSTNDPCQIVTRAAEVLANWPKNFVRLLQDLGKRMLVGGKSGVCAQFQSIYGSLFKNKAIASPKQIDFLRKAFLEFVTSHWDGGFVDHKLLKALNATASTKKRFITQTEFASRLGVQQSTAVRFLNKQEVPPARIQSGGSRRFLIDSEKMTISKTMPGTIYRVREAAKLLGFSVSVLQALKVAGVYEVSNMLPTRAGYHERDIESLSYRLLSLSLTKKVSMGMTEVIAMRDVLSGRHYSTEIKVSVVPAILSKGIETVANADETAGGLLIDRDAYHAFVQLARNRAAGNASSPAEAAKALLCDASTIPGLMEAGLLEGSKTPTGLRITDASIQEFKRTFVSLACLAKELHTTTRALMRRCVENDVEMLLASSRRNCGPQPFLRISDRPLLRLKNTVARELAENPLITVDSTTAQSRTEPTMKRKEEAKAQRWPLTTME